MSTHPLWRPFEQPDDDRIAEARVGPRTPTLVDVVPSDPSWPALFEQLRGRIVAALGDRALSVSHMGSTSIPGLAAKPLIDIDLIVADSADEAAYVPDLEAAGFPLRIREPEWEEHRMMRCDDPNANVHVFSPDAPEPHRHRMFRAWLLNHDDDRAAYADLKTRLGQQGFTDQMHYNNAKGGLIYDIYERIFAADPEHPHDPQPRG